MGILGSKDNSNILDLLNAIVHKKSFYVSKRLFAKQKIGNH